MEVGAEVGVRGRGSGQAGWSRVGSGGEGGWGGVDWGGLTRNGVAWNKYSGVIRMEVD